MKAHRAKCKHCKILLFYYIGPVGPRQSFRRFFVVLLIGGKLKKGEIVPHCVCQGVTKADFEFDPEKIKLDKDFLL